MIFMTHHAQSSIHSFTIKHTIHMSTHKYELLVQYAGYLDSIRNSSPIEMPVHLSRHPAIVETQPHHDCNLIGHRYWQPTTPTLPHS